jgi:MFS transporter, putative metabolite:H+ symporter
MSVEANVVGGSQTGRAVGPLELKALEAKKFRNVCDTSRLTSTHWHVAFSNGLGWAFDGMDFALLGMVTPLLMKEFGLSLPEYRAGVQLFGIAAVVGALVWPFLADRFGRRTILAINIGIFSLLMPMAAIAPTWEWFVATYLAIRFSLAGEWAVGAPLVAETWPARWRGLVLGANRSAYSLGIALAGLLTTYIASQYGWRAAFYVPGAVAILAIYIRMLVPESPEWVRARDRIARISSDIANKKVLSADDREWHAKAMTIQFWQLFLPDVRGKTLLVTVVYIGILTSFTTVTYFLPLFLAETHGWSTAQYGVFFTWWGVVGIPAYWISGGISDKIGRRPAFVVCLTLAALFLAIWSYCDSTTALWIVGMIWAFTYAGIYGPLASYLSEMYPTRARATGTGFTLATANFVGLVIWPYVLVWLRETTGSFRAGFFVSAGILCLVGAIVWIFSPEGARKELDTISV